MTDQSNPSNDQKIKEKSSSRQNILTVAKGGSIGFAGKLFVQLLSLLFIYIVARFLGAEQYGLYKLAVTISMIVSAICMIGLDGGVKRYISLARVENNRAKIWGVIQLGTWLPAVIGLLFTLILFLGASPIAEYIFKKPELSEALKLISLSIPFLVLIQSLKAIAIGFKKIEYNVLAYDIGFNLIKLLLSLVVLAIGYQILGVVVAYIGSAIISAVFLFYLVNKLFPLGQVPAQAEHQTKDIITFSLPLFLSLLLNQFGRNFETLVLGAYGLLVDVGVYSVILSISAIGNMGFVALRTIAAPIFAELHSQNKEQELRNFYQVITKWSLAFNFPIFLTVIIFGENLLSIFGKDFSAGSLGLVILASSTLFNACTGACGTLLNMSGYSKVNFYNSIVYLVATLALDFALIPSYGLIGAALAGALTIVIVNTLMSIEAYVLLNRIVPFNLSFYKPLVAAIIAGAVAFFLKTNFWTDKMILPLVIFGISMWLLYLGIIYLLGLSDEDKLIFKQLKRKKNKKNKS